ncbi:MAG: DUF47 domain-containing protein [Pyrinomonadaceae bacterium]
MAFFNLLPREDEYFAFFSQMTDQIREASDALVEMMQTTSENFEAYSRRIKDAEHACDELTHKITTKLNKSFITPFDREDIFMLVISLDDVLDYIDAGARAVLMYGIKEINEHARRFAKVIQGLAIELHSAVSMLAKPDGMNQHIVEIHRLENEADDVYFRAIAELFRNGSDPMTVIKFKELYEILESATDKCETVANIIESIVIKHN